MKEPAEKITPLKFLNSNYLEIPSEADCLQNGHILYTYFSLKKKSFSTVSKVFVDGHCIQISKTTILNLVKKFKSYHSLKRDTEFSNFKIFCAEKFTKFVALPSSSQQSTSSPPHVSSSEVVSSESSSSTAVPVAPVITPKSSTPPKISAGERSLQRKGKLTPIKAQMQRRLDFSRQNITELKKQLKESKVKLAERKVKHKYRYWRQIVARKQEQLRRKDAKLSKVRIDKSDAALTYRRKFINARKSNKRLEDKLAKSMDEHKAQLKELREKKNVILDLQDQVFQLEEKIQDLENKLQEKHQSARSESGKGRPFNANTRNIVYQMLDCSVPTEKIPILMKKVAEHYDVSLTNVPHPTSVQAMAREMGVISDFMTAEFLLKNENTTLGFDATTQEGVHVNSIHVTSPSECKVIALDELPGGKAVDYSRHIEDSITNLAQTYSSIKEVDLDDTRSKMIRNITNCITDRAVVNHATIASINESWGKELNELNCHLHPLDSIATSCKKGLKQVEEKHNVTGKKLYGADCSASQLVLAINKMRYKDGTGDPKAFKAALVQASLPKGFIPRYRGNRLHVLFAICGKLTEQEEFFTQLFNSTLSSEKLRKAVRNDFAMQHAKVELRILGLVGKLLTGPWMSKFYVDHLSDIEHLEAFDMVKQVIVNIEHFILHPAETLQATRNFFGDELPLDDATIQCLQMPVEDGALFDEMMTSCLSSTKDVLVRQYERYFDRDVTDELKEETRSARLHNIDAEQIMGMFSAIQKSKTNATIDYISCGIRARKNEVLSYLDAMPEDKKSLMINAARPIARKQRATKRKTAKEIEAEILKRIAVNRQKRDQSTRKKLEKDFANNVVTPKDYPHHEKELASTLEGGLVGKLISHVWFEEEKDVLYLGRVEKFLPEKKRQKAKYVIAYWQDGQTYEEDGEDFKISIYELAVDIIFEDLIIH